jgi:hypothetical protein
MEEPLYQWVDANPPSTPKRFSVRRTAKLFIAIMVLSILGSLPLGLWQYGVHLYREHRAEQQRQERLDQEMRNLEKAARDGKTGEATRRLFGISEPQQSAAPHPAGTASSASPKE